MDAFALKNAAIVTPRKIRDSATLLVEGGKVVGFGLSSKLEIEVGRDSFIYPALVNVHDHLRDDWLPRVGPPGGDFYPDWSRWDADLEASPAFAERAALDLGTMYALGAYKNLFSGVATVQDHFPHELSGPHLAGLPIRVVREYCLSHECSPRDLGWGDGIEAEHARAVERNWPFVTHLEEGFDPESMDGVGVLERALALDEHDLLVHCLGLSDEDIHKLRRAQASVAWCPASDELRYNLTCKIRKLLRAGVNVALGTDSTRSGSPSLLAEMKFARECYRRMYGEDLPAKTLFDMVTANAAKALRQEARIGILEPGALADIAVFRARAEDPYESLCRAECGDLELLVVGGEAVFGLESAYGELFDGAAEPGRVTVSGRKVLVKGDPAALYRRVREAVGFDKKLDYLPFDV